MSRDALAETRFGQERMLLYSIINAVTDPDPAHGHRRQADHRERRRRELFAAPEDASEGWRRAVD